MAVNDWVLELDDHRREREEKLAWKWKRRTWRYIDAHLRKNAQMLAAALQNGIDHYMTPQPRSSLMRQHEQNEKSKGAKISDIFLHATIVVGNACNWVSYKWV